MNELDVKIPIFTTFTTVANENAKQIAGEALNGVYFYDPNYNAEKPEFVAFLEEYKQRFGKDPAVPFHTAATYDTVRILVDAIRAAGNDGEKVHDWLLNNVKNYDGYMGTFSFDEKGNVQTGFKLKIVQDGEFVAVKK
jgi:branched-chain amino acid transport system substrate-binding protein